MLVSSIYERLGVHLVWHTGDLPIGSSHPAFSIRTADHPLDSATPEALASTRIVGSAGTEIVVYKDRLQRLIAGHPTIANAAAAYVLAHELAHAMQGVARHSEGGIMKAHWVEQDYHEMLFHKLAFTAADVDLIHNGLTVQAAAANTPNTLTPSSRLLLMNPDLWDRVAELYHAAIERPAGERAHFLARECSGNPELHREVESLLAHEGEADSLLDAGPWKNLAGGSVLGVYRIISKLGQGGMGEVFRATDTRLHREVALKVVAREYASDPNWLARFQREARLLASLNHPHIAAIYGLEESAGQCAIAMELVQGVSLAERMAKSRISLPEALSIAPQIAEALEYAHEEDIVHRDLKPANVILRPDGVVKVLDFGLAKVLKSEGSPAETATRTGVVMGTPAYMPPEQASGKHVDRRADIWAFGVVLFEMLAGRQVYARESTLETLTAVVRDEPPWKDLPTETPPAIVSLLHRCLDKDPKRRLRDIGEARVILELRLSEPLHAAAATPSVPPSSRNRRPNPAWIVSGLLAASLAVLALLHFREKPAEPVFPRYYSIVAPENTLLGSTAGIAPGGAVQAVSPDGRHLVFTAISPDGISRFWIRSLESPEARPLAGTERASHPFWSPDSRQIGYWADGKLKRISAAGGPPVTLCDAFDARGGTWNRDDVIVFAPSHRTPLFRVSALGGACTQVTKLETTGGVAHRYPWFLPDGRHFLFMVSPTASAPDSVTIWVGSLDSPQTKKLLEANSNAQYSQGYLLFLRENNTLIAQAFDPQRLEIEGAAVPLAADVQSAATAARGRFSVSENGLLVYQTGAPGMRQLIWFDRAGNRLSNVGDPGRFDSVEFSTDRKFFAVTLTEQRNTDIWLYDTATTRRTRFTFDPAVDHEPVWSPDGGTIAFASNRRGHFDLYRKRSDGSGTEELLYADDQDKSLSAWSPDGKFLLYMTRSTTLWLLPLAEGRSDGPVKPQPVPEAGSLGRFSPNGGWIAAQSNQSGRSEVYVWPFSGIGPTRAGKIQVSTAAAMMPRWRPDGKELFFVAPDGMFMSAEVKPQGKSMQIGSVHSLARIGLVSGRFYDASADGQRFLVAVPLERPNTPFTVVENWTAGFK
jgi:serine/threonine protein kinase/Tol biopolymer transport system component